MTTTVANSYNVALLSEASYVLFDLLKNYSPDTVKEALQNTIDGLNTEGEFSVTQAAEFVDNWEVIDHQEDTASGFSATLFKSKDPNAVQPYVLAIRGTDGWQDLVVADGFDIATDGLALQQ